VTVSHGSILDPLRPARNDPEVVVVRPSGRSINNEAVANADELPVSTLVFSGHGGPWFAYGLKAWAYFADTLNALPGQREVPRAVAAYDGGELIRVASHLRVEMYAGDVETTCACAHGCSWNGRLAEMWMWHGQLVCEPCSRES
jgi:hypothetical protein